MRNTIKIPNDWSDEAIDSVFKEIIAGYVISGGLTLEKRSPNQYYGSIGSKKRAKFLGGMALEYHGDFIFELNQNPKLLHVDWDQGKMLKVGKYGMKMRKIFWSNLIEAMEKLLGKPYSDIPK